MLGMLGGTLCLLPFSADLALLWLSLVTALCVGVGIQAER